MHCYAPLVATLDLLDMDANVPAVKPRGLLSVMSRLERAGEWDLPARFWVRTVMGNVRIDLTRARFLPGTSEIEVLAIMGEVRITIPHGVKVECDGGGLWREFRVKRVSNAVPRPDAPCVRITGSAYMGTVIVRVVDPDGKR
jgi:Cell wall-active antibiotics response 4TMS YvqF